MKPFIFPEAKERGQLIRITPQPLLQGGAEVAISYPATARKDFNRHKWMELDMRLARLIHDAVNEYDLRLEDERIEKEGGKQ